MSYTTKVISIGGLNVEPGSGYQATFLMSFAQPENSIFRVPRDSDSPVVTNIAPGVHTYLLQVLVDAAATADDIDAKRRSLMKALDTSRGPVTVTIENATGTARRRYMNFVVTKVDQAAGQFGLGFAAQLESADVVRWRSTAAAVDSWSMNASGSHVVTVAGDMDVFPCYTLTPNSKASPVWTYRRPFIIEWRSPERGWHPIDVTGGGWDTAALIGAGKLTGETNVAVQVGNTVIAHWYGNTEGNSGGFNHAATRVWVNIEFKPRTEMRLLTGSGSLDTTMQVYADGGFPASGVLKIDSEYVSYTGHVPGWITGVKRGLYGTTAAAHLRNAVMVPVVVGNLLYGPNGGWPEGFAPTGKEPTFIPNTFSSNEVWHYSYFRRENGAAGWQRGGLVAGPVLFSSESTATGSYDASGDLPWNAMGFAPGWTQAAWYEASFALPLQQVRVIGRRYIKGSPATLPNAATLMAWNTQGTRSQTVWRSNNGADRFPNPTFDETLDIYMPATADGSNGMTYLMWGFNQSNHMQVDIGQMYVFFDTDYTPLVTLATEQTDYDLDVVITNVTTGESISVFFPDMEPGESLVIDSKQQTAVYSYDGRSRYGAVRRNAPRAKWLRLVPGLNQIQIAEAGMGTLDINVTYEPLWYT